MHLQTKQCCGREFKASDSQGRLLKQRDVFGKYDPKLYGGNVQKFGEAACPVCGTHYYLWLKSVGKTFKVLTISLNPNKAPSVETFEIDDSPDFDAMNRDALRKWLKDHEIKYTIQWGADKLRELAKSNLVAV